MKKNYINGEWVSSDELFQNISPSDMSDVVGEYARGSVSDMKDAIQAASDACASWRGFNAQERCNLLRAVGNKIIEKQAVLGELLSREEGKTLPEGIGEVGRAAQIFLFFANEALMIGGENLSSVRSGVDILTSREPVGVIGMITPWNFPIAIPAWKMAPALAYGNTIVIKPAESVPGSVTALMEIFDEVGLPPGVVNMVNGSGREIGSLLLESDKVNAISFTGSQATGSLLAVKAAETGKKIQMEMGGKNPLVILDDADLSVAVDCAVNGAYFSTGQRCTASSRFIVTENIHNEFEAALVDRIGKLKIGHALNGDTDIGPVANIDQIQQNMEYVDIGKNEGAMLKCGGEYLTSEKEGYYMAPTLFSETNNSMRINREEIFGPVAAITRVKDYEEALSIANDTIFGLCGGICTTSLKYATDFRKNAQVGMAMVNLPTAGVDYHVPFGGVKGSSYGAREQGMYAKEFYTQVKTTYIQA